MNILVYNVAAEYAGALTILKQFHNEVVACQDKSHTWYFVVSADVLEETDNVKVIRVPWIKKSWFHRWCYDKFCARKLIKQYNIDLVFSMQNMPIDGVKCPQVVYLHQSLQFSPVKYSFFKKEERLYWIRQNIICNLMRRALKKADSIIVQTKWMQEATKKWLDKFDKKIQVVFPNVEIEVNDEIQIEKERQLFIYPAGDGIHKNHQLIIKACEILSERDVPYRVFFTMTYDSNPYARDLYEQVEKKKLNIEFVGLLSNDEIMKLYRKATLVFPSYIETFGLPLLEAKLSNGMILCSDLPFAHEILDDYDNVKFFDVNDVKQLANYMIQCCEGTIEVREESNVQTLSRFQNDKTLIESILERK